MVAIVTNEKKIEILIGIYKRRLKRLKLDPDTTPDIRIYAEEQLKEFIRDLKSLSLIIK